MVSRATKDTEQRSIWRRYGFTGLVAIIVSRFSRYLNSPCPLILPDGTFRDRKWMGEYGERTAVDWLRSHRHKILARNFRAPRGGEVDIVAREGNQLLFIEVKTRREGSTIRPFDAVDRGKQRLIERGANEWLKRLGTRSIRWRFDVIEIHLADRKTPRVNHIRNAF